ncbi:MAG: tartrate dehydrogenase/decarboxylase/D-malate dehydrogenase [Saprospiraceae bacterium]|jgi:tartrate dehydrogenase/decarboxylase/D-malate dehydrogenase
MELVMAAAQKHNFKLETQSFPFGAGYSKKEGKFMPDNGLEILKELDAIFFGAVGLPDVDDRLPFKDYTNKVITAFKQYVNYRPVNYGRVSKALCATKQKKT